MAVEEASLRDGDPEKRPRVSDAVDIFTFLVCFKGKKKRELVSRNLQIFDGVSLDLCFYFLETIKPYN